MVQRSAGEEHPEPTYDVWKYGLQGLCAPARRAAACRVSGEVGFAEVSTQVSYAGFASQVSTQASMLVLLPHALLGSGRCVLWLACAL